MMGILSRRTTVAVLIAIVSFVSIHCYTHHGVVNKIGSLRLMKHRGYPLFAEVSAEIDVNVLPDSKRKLSEILEIITNNLAKDVIDYAALVQQVKDLEQESAQPEFWDDQSKAQATLAELNKVKGMVERVDKWKRNCEDAEMLLELAMEDPSEAG